MRPYGAVATGLILIAAVAIARVDRTPVVSSGETIALTADRPRLWLLSAAAMIASMAMGPMEMGIRVRGLEALGLSASSIVLTFSGCGLVMILAQTNVFRPQREVDAERSRCAGRRWRRRAVANHQPVDP